MNKEITQKKLFSRRAILLGSLKAALLAGLVGRMFYLQVVARDKFIKLSDKNRTRKQIIVPLRGKILDRNKSLLAKNVKSFQLIYTKSDSISKNESEEIVLKLNKTINLNLTPSEQNELIKSIMQLKIDDYIVVKESLTWKELSELEVNLYQLPGTSIEIGYERQYPFAKECAHLTGYIGNIAPNEKIKSEHPIYPNYKVGKNGIEKSKEQVLHGKPGYNNLEVNAKGIVIKEISTYSAAPGVDVELSIDVEIQKRIFELLDETGVGMLAKIESGEILASVSKPGFDPNLFNQGISSTQWNNLVNDPELPLIDRCVALNYPPGSAFKINTAIAAIKNNFDPETKFTCPGYYMVGDRAFKCWNKAGHGTINLYQAIAGSCNVYFWSVAKIIGIMPIVDIARKLGYGQKQLNQSLPREQSGLIPDPEWKLERFKSKWTFADTVNSTIGQGYVEATPIQMLTMTARIASGLEFKPTIFKTNAATNFPSLGLDKELNLVRKGMEMCTHNPIGTAYNYRIINEEFAMAGKTGTCQVISKRHKDDDLSLATVDKKHRNHGVFVAYAPTKAPKYAFLSIIEHGGTPRKAIKLANEILSLAQTKKV